MTHRTPLAMLLGTALLGSGCAGNTRDELGAADVRNVDQVTDSPERYIGRSITVRGEMDDVRSPRAFTLEDHDWVFPEELLVIAPNQPAAGTAGLEQLADRQVTVTGTVRRLVVAELEREFDLDLDREFELEFRDRPVLVADRIVPNPTADRPAGAPETADTAAVLVRAAPVTDLLLIVPVPGTEELVGQEVRLTDVEVRSRAGDRGIWIGPSHTQQVFVRAADGAGLDDIEAGDRVSVDGTIRRVPDRERARTEWGLDSTQAALVARNEALYIAADQVTRAE